MSSCQLGSYRYCDLCTKSFAPMQKAWSLLLLLLHYQLYEGKPCITDTAQK